MEAMLDLPSELAAASGSPGQGGAEETPGDDNDEAYAADNDEAYAAAVAQNAQLKMMLQQLEEQERQEQLARSRMPPRQMHPSNTRSRAGAASPSHLGHAKKGGWGGTTHTDGRSHEIDRDNQILVQKLSNIAIRPTMNTQLAPFRQRPDKTSVAINRRRQDDKIARENAALAKRLNSVKATTTLSNKTAATHAKKHDHLVKMIGGPGVGGVPMGQLPPPSRARSAASRTAVLPSVRGPFE